MKKGLVTLLLVLGATGICLFRTELTGDRDLEMNSAAERTSGASSAMPPSFEQASGMMADQERQNDRVGPRRKSRDPAMATGTPDLVRDQGERARFPNLRAAAGSVHKKQGDAPGVPVILALPAADLELSDEDVRRWDEIAENFVNAIGGENQDPADPAYLERWNSARSEADYLFRLHFGRRAFVKQNLATGAAK